jgi:pimeloyl-ACP methyl ester carboxylesterase
VSQPHGQRTTPNRRPPARQGSTRQGVGFEVHGAGPPVLFLHGLTFDRRTWLPIVDDLGDHATAALLDLPGHGSSRCWVNYDLERVTEALHDAIDDLGLRRPVVVGHSISGLLAFLYASRYPTAAVVNIDLVLHLEAFLEIVRSVAPQLHSQAFPDIWRQFQDGMHLELIPAPSRALVTASMHVDQELVLGYWAPLFTATPTELAEQIDDVLARTLVPALAIHGDPPDDTYRGWLQTRCPSAQLEVWPNSGHFPHLVHPQRFSRRLLRVIDDLNGEDEFGQEE